MFLPCINKVIYSILTPTVLRGLVRFFHYNHSLLFCFFVQWRLPWRSCDIVAYLFMFYCLVLIVFIAMVLWIASRRCLTPICVVLYFSCGLAVCYFTYCCGCIEHIRYYWKAWIELNRQWLILTHKDSVQTPGIVSRMRNNESRKGSAEYVWV